MLLIFVFYLCKSSHKRRIERRDKAIVAKLLVAHINNKATGMLNKSDPLEAYPSDSFRWNRVKSIGMKPGEVWTCGTCSRQRWNWFSMQCGQGFSHDHVWWCSRLTVATLPTLVSASLWSQIPVFTFTALDARHHQLAQKVGVVTSPCILYLCDRLLVQLIIIYQNLIMRFQTKRTTSKGSNILWNDWSSEAIHECGTIYIFMSKHKTIWICNYGIWKWASLSTLGWPTW